MTSHATRRTFLAGLSSCVLAGAARPDSKKPKILLRSGWQTVNIGDIGHTPGALTLLDRYFPEAQITLWPNRLTPEVRGMLMKGYPRLKSPRAASPPKTSPTRLSFREPGKRPISI